ncbi:MAG: glycosyltransferase [Phycisphaerae bacterium]|nr:glycosyltransferase [Phycisphaerae bacterium]
MAPEQEHHSGGAEFDSASFPLVSVIIPCRNEAGFIERTIRSLLRNEYPQDLLEILVVDGMSNDDTRNKVQTLSEEDNRIRLIDNPRRTAPTAFNTGIEQSRGEILIIIGGHAEADADFIRNSVQTLLNHPEASRAGGVMETVGTSYMGKVVAAAMSSMVGMGSRKYRLDRGQQEDWVSAAPFAACWRWVYDTVGRFDESLVRNCDTDFTFRAAKSGVKTRLNSSIRSKYFCRASLYKLARQQWLDGFWRVRNIQKVGRPAHPRQLAPLLFVLGWIALIVLSLLWPWGKWFLLAYAGCYATGILCGALAAIPRHGWKVAPLMPLTFIVMHFSYGLGSLHGIWSWVILRGRFQPKPESYSLTR